MNNEEKVKLALRIIDEIPPLYHPRIGGSLALYIYKEESNVRDIDLIVDKIDEKLKLPYKQLHFNHALRLNDSIRYEIDGVIVEIHESLMPYNPICGKIEPIGNIIKSRQLIKRFLNIVYGETVQKWRSKQ